jgi:hypothetical protein
VGSVFNFCPDLQPSQSGAVAKVRNTPPIYLPRFEFVAYKLQSGDNFMTIAKTAVCSIFDKEVTSDQN